jgi:hypothetical protein
MLSYDRIGDLRTGSRSAWFGKRTGQAVRTDCQHGASDRPYLQRWSAVRRKDPWVQMGADEIYFGKQVLPLHPLESSTLCLLYA